MTWRWMCLKAKGSVPMGFSELPAGRSCLALGWSWHTSIVPLVPAPEQLL